MLFADLKRILGRGLCGARNEFLLAATAQNLGKLAKFRPVSATVYADGASGGGSLTYTSG